MSLTALVDQLEATPLLGRGRRRAVALAAELAGALARSPNDQLERRVLAVAGRMALTDGASSAVAQLGEAHRLAAAEGDGLAAAQLSLLMCRALAERQGQQKARKLLDAVESLGLEGASLAPDLALARAACHPEEERVHLESALTLLPSPGRDAERLQCHLRLAELLSDGGDPARARAHLSQALSIGKHHEDTVSICHAAALLGNLLVTLGLPIEAEVYLYDSIDAARALDDDLTLVTQSLVLSGVWATAGRWREAADLSLTIEEAALRRRNWLAWASARLTRATRAARDGDHDLCLLLLAEGHRWLQRRGAEGAVNLLTAHLAELRLQLCSEEGGWSHEDFGSAFQRAVDRATLRE